RASRVRLLRGLEYSRHETGGAVQCWEATSRNVRANTDRVNFFAPGRRRQRFSQGNQGVVEMIQCHLGFTPAPFGVRGEPEGAHRLKDTRRLVVLFLQLLDGNPRPSRGRSW